MNSWLDLENRFRALIDSLRFLRLDIQWGSSGEHWNLTGMQHSSAVRQFETLCGVAGRMLELAMSKTEEPGMSFLRDSNPRIRWYRALKDLSGEFRVELPGTEIDVEGNPLGHIYFGSLNNVVEVAANLCLSLHADYPVQDKRHFWKRVYDDYGREIVIGAFVALITAIIGLFFG